MQDHDRLKLDRAWSKFWLLARSHRKSLHHLRSWTSGEPCRPTQVFPLEYEFEPILAGVRSAISTDRWRPRGILLIWGNSCPIGKTAWGGHLKPAEPSEPCLAAVAITETVFAPLFVTQTLFAFGITATPLGFRPGTAFPPLGWCPCRSPGDCRSHWSKLSAAGIDLCGYGGIPGLAP